MAIVLPKLPEPAVDEAGPYCLIAKHRAQPGALQFHIHRARFERNLFVIYEIWRDVKALREHFEKPYVKQFVADSAQYIEGDMEVQWLIMASRYVAKPREEAP